MTPEEAAAACVPAQESLAHILWLRDEPEMVALATERGTRGWGHYVVSRAGWLPTEAWEAALYVLPAELVSKMAGRFGALGPAYVAEALDAAGAALRRQHPAPPPPALAELAGRVAPTRPLSQAWAAARVGDPHADAVRAVMVLREERAAGHYAAAGRAGLDPLGLLIVSEAFHGAGPGRGPAFFRWDQDLVAGARERLRESGWLDAAGRLTPDGGRRREAIERDTEAHAAQPFSALSPGQRRAAAEALRELGGVGEPLTG